MGVQKETVIETCSAAYGRICMDYSTVPFNDMDPNDEDFKFFFDYKEMLDELGRGLKFFFDRCHKEKFNVLNEWPEYKEVGLIIKKIGGRDYASEILQKYGLEFSESAPSK